MHWMLHYLYDICLLQRTTLFSISAFIRNGHLFMKNPFLLRALLHLIFNYLRPKNHKTYMGVFMMATFFLLACRKTNLNNFARICVFPIIVKCGLHIFLPSIIFPKKKTRTFETIWWNSAKWSLQVKMTNFLYLWPYCFQPLI